MTLILPQPRLDLTINGDKASSAFMSDVLSFTYTDEAHGKSDSVDVQMQDGFGLYRAASGPGKHDIIEATIGYLGGAALPCGEFECDTPKASGSRSGDTFNINGTSTATSKKLRTKSTEAFEKQNLSQIVEKVTARNGLSLVSDIDDIYFERQTMRRERDLQFLRRLAEDTGHYFTVKGKQAVFIKRESLEEQSPVHIFSLEAHDYLKNWSCQEETTGTYSEAQVQYVDVQSNKLIKATAKDEEVTTGDVLNITERAENQGQAERKAKSRLAFANDIKCTGQLDLVGMTDIIAGTIIGLDSSFGRYAGRYLVETSRHSISRSSGYTTSPQIKRIGAL